MARSEAAARPASLYVEEYRDSFDDNDEREVNTDDYDDDVPLLQVAAETVTPPRKRLVLPEIPTFLYFVALMTQAPVQQFWLFDYFSKQLLWQKSNETDRSECDNTSSSNSSSVENEVQALANQFVMYTSFLSSFTAIFPTLFLGPLTDKFGRKFAFYISLLMLFGSQAMMLVVFHFELSPYVLLVSSLLLGLSGNFGLYLAAAFGMVADLSSSGKARTFRVTTLEVSIAFGISLGQTTSGIWVNNMGYVWPMAFTLGLILVAVLFFLVFIPETYTERHHQPFSCKTLLKCFEFYVKDTPNGRRLKLTICLATFVIYMAAVTGESNFGMLYLLHQPFCWQKEQITVFGGVVSLVRWLLIMLFVRLGRRWISEPVFALVGTVSLTANFLLKGLAWDNLLIFVGAGIGLLTDIVSPICRAMMSKAVSEKEQGALFSGIGVLQMIITAVSGLVMSVVYKAGLGFFLGLPYLVLAALSFTGTVLIIGLIIRTKRHPEQELLVVGDEETITQINS